MFHVVCLILHDFIRECVFLLFPLSLLSLDILLFVFVTEAVFCFCKFVFFPHIILVYF